MPIHGSLRMLLFLGLLSAAGCGQPLFNHVAPGGGGGGGGGKVTFTTYVALQRNPGFAVQRFGTTGNPSGVFTTSLAGSLLGMGVDGAGDLVVGTTAAASSSSTPTISIYKGAAQLQSFATPSLALTLPSGTNAITVDTLDDVLYAATPSGIVAYSHVSTLTSSAFSSQVAAINGIQCMAVDASTGSLVAYGTNATIYAFVPAVVAPSTPNTFTVPSIAKGTVGGCTANFGLLMVSQPAVGVVYAVPDNAANGTQIPSNDVVAILDKQDGTPSVVYFDPTSVLEVAAAGGTTLDYLSIPPQFSSATLALSPEQQLGLSGGAVGLAVDI